MCKQKTRKSINTNVMMCHQQSGFSLVMVMMIMVVIALLVIAGAQVSNTEMRISTNNADQKFARGLAEKTLLVAENKVTEIVFDISDFGGSGSGGTGAGGTGGGDAGTGGGDAGGGGAGGDDAAPVSPAIAESEIESKGFAKDTCADGLCGINGAMTANHNVHVWEFGDDGKSYLSENGKAVSDLQGEASKAPRYMVEYLGVKQVDGAPNLRIFRITSRAWGKNANTVSTLQTVVVAPAN